MFRISGFVIRIFTLALFLTGPKVSADDFLQATTPRTWSFPRDHGRHDGYKIEWWYFTGNLADDTGRRFGYQLTIFRSAIVPHAATRPSPWGTGEVYFAHAAVSDVNGKQLHFSDRLERARPGLAWAAADTLDVQLLDWTIHQQPGGGIALNADENDFALNLLTGPGRGPVLQGPGGVNAKSARPGHASYYYSLTRLPTAGTLRLGNATFHVTGQSWMDHEFSSNSLSKNQTGWDWMGLQLDDGTDLMIYRMRNKAGSTDYLSGTRITPDGVPHYLTADDITLAGRDAWTSPASGGRYPQEWTLRVPGGPLLTVKSEFPDQELVTTDSTDVTYFEGASKVLNSQQEVVGRGYLEMTGYAKPLGK